MALSKEDLEKILEAKLLPLHDAIAQLKTDLREMSSFLDEANRKYEEVSNKLINCEAENATLKNAINELNQRVNQLENESNDVRQYTRRDCLEIRGIPAMKNEDTNHIVSQVGDLMDVYLDEKAISVSHRLPVSKKYKGKDTNPAVIVKFVRRTDKERFYRARSKLKGCTARDLQHDENTPIYISECLTDRNKKIFKAGLKFKKDHKYAYIWTSNGKTYIRKDDNSKAFAINSLDDLRRLRPV